MHSDDLPFTGERFVPGVRGEIWMEHWHRYHLAARWAAGKRVLDVACGEGYGSALLARCASHVAGVDLSDAAIAHARKAYAGTPNLEFHVAPCTRLPLADASIDLAVSFETIEHIGEQSEFLAELARVLHPGGVLVLSCPNKLEYSDRRNYVNEFHVKEPYRDELAALVAARFPHAQWYGQRPTFFSVIAPESPPAAGQVLEVDEATPDRAQAHLQDPLYFIVAASRDAQALAAIAPTLSVLADRGDFLHRDYAKVIRELREETARRQALEAELAKRDEEKTREPAVSGWRKWLRGAG